MVAESLYKETSPYSGTTSNCDAKYLNGLSNAKKARLASPGVGILPPFNKEELLQVNWTGCCGRDTVEVLPGMDMGSAVGIVRVCVCVSDRTMPVLYAGWLNVSLFLTRICVTHLLIATHLLNHITTAEHLQPSNRHWGGREQQAA